MERLSQRNYVYVVRMFRRVKTVKPSTTGEPSELLQVTYALFSMTY